MRRYLSLLSLSLLFLTSCTPQRVLTDLSEEDFIPYVALQDGYLHFTNDKDINGPYLSQASIHMIVTEAPDYQDIVADLGMDPVEMSKTLPEKYHLTPEALQEVLIEPETEHYPAGGYSFLLRGDPGDYYFSEWAAVYPEFRLTIKRMIGTEGSEYYFYPQHERWLVFNVLPWERCFGMDLGRSYRSEVNGQAVGVTHRMQHNYAFFPGEEWDYFYGGFYVGDLAVSIESEYGYCTQAEFVEVFLAIFDYLTALEQ